MKSNPHGLSTGSPAHGMSTRRSGIVWISLIFGLEGEDESWLLAPAETPMDDE
jgi:hypothetical protein